MSKSQVDLNTLNGIEAKDEDDNAAGSETSLVTTFSVTFEPEFWEKIWSIEQQLSVDLMKIDFMKDKNIGAVYNPLDYAADVHKNFMRKFLRKAPTVLFLGMNPGLYGMCQTSASSIKLQFYSFLFIFINSFSSIFQIPFGHVPSVRDWLKIQGEVKKPDCEIPSKPIEGFSCKREEQSGKRFWGVLEELCIEPENFFRHCFVYNICPIAFLTSTGRNITPPEIKGEAKSQVTSISLSYLKTVIDIFQPKIIVSIGSYANDRVKDLKKKNLIADSIDCKLIPHPSPRSLNNQDWVNKAKTWFDVNDISKFFKN